MNLEPVYVSVKEAADLLEISERLLRRFLRHNRINGAVRLGGKWQIPVPFEIIPSELSSTTHSGKVLEDAEGVISSFHGFAEATDPQQPMIINLELAVDEIQEIPDASYIEGVSVSEFLRQAALDRAREKRDLG